MPALVEQPVPQEYEQKYNKRCYQQDIPTQSKCTGFIPWSDIVIVCYPDRKDSGCHRQRPPDSQRNKVFQHAESSFLNQPPFVVIVNVAVKYGLKCLEGNRKGLIYRGY
jgi:hypothetical protein